MKKAARPVSLAALDQNQAIGLVATIPPAARTCSDEKLAPVFTTAKLRTMNSTDRVGFKKTETHNSFLSILSGVLFDESQTTL
jgi:hypothetical protein